MSYRYVHIPRNSLLRSFQTASSFFRNIQKVVSSDLRHILMFIEGSETELREFLCKLEESWTRNYVIFIPLFFTSTMSIAATPVALSVLNPPTLATIRRGLTRLGSSAVSPAALRHEVGCPYWHPLRYPTSTLGCGLIFRRRAAQEFTLEPSSVLLFAVLYTGNLIMPVDVFVYN